MAAQFGRRLRRSAMTTAVAAVAVAALSASQAPGRDRHAATADSPPARATPSDPDVDDGAPATRRTTPTCRRSTAPPRRPVRAPARPAGTGARPRPAYPRPSSTPTRRPRRRSPRSKPGCNLPWQLLAAIGKVESGQARGGNVDANGTTITPILGPVLDGNGFARITDTDNGAYDGDTHARPCRRPHAVHPVHLGVVGPRRQRRRQEGPQQHLRRGPRRRPLPVPVRLRPVRAGRPQRARSSATTTRRSTSTRSCRGWSTTARAPTRSRTARARPALETAATTATGPAPRRRRARQARPAQLPEHRRAAQAAQARARSRPPRPRRRARRATTPLRPRPPRRWTTWRTRAPGKLTATAGDAFAEKVAVRTETEAGKARRRRSGCGSPSSATRTPPSPAARPSPRSSPTAPARPPRPRSWRVRRPATSPSAPPSSAATLPGLDYTATVTARQADTLARTSDTALTCVAGRRVRGPGRGEGHLQGRRRRRGRGHRHAHQVGGRRDRERQGPLLQGRGRQDRPHPHGPQDGRRRPAEAAEAVRGRHHRHVPAPHQHHRRRDAHGRAEGGRGRRHGQPSAEPVAPRRRRTPYPAHSAAAPLRLRRRGAVVCVCNVFSSRPRRCYGAGPDDVSVPDPGPSGGSACVPSSPPRPVSPSRSPWCSRSRPWAHRPARPRRSRC